MTEIPRGRFLGRHGHGDHQPEERPEVNQLPANLEKPWWERVLFRRRSVVIAGVGGGIILGGGAVAWKTGFAESLFVGAKKDVIKSKRDDFLNNVPTQEQLLHEFPGLNRKIELASTTIANRRFMGAGDSMGIKNGIRHDSQMGYQQDSYLDFVQRTAKRVASTKGEAWTWTGDNYHVPGAQTGDENRDFILGQRQLGNEALPGDMIQTMIHAKDLEAVCYSANGDDWRKLIPTQDALNRYEYLLENAENLSDSDLAELQGMATKHDQVVAEFKQNFIRALAILDNVNNIRASGEVNGETLKPLKLILILPLDYREVDYLPAQPLDSTSNTATTIYIGGSPNAQKAAYHITMGIIQAMKEGLEEYSKLITPTFSVHAISKFGLEEKDENGTPIYLDTTVNPGHLNKNGQAAVAQKIFELLAREGSDISLAEEGFVVLPDAA